MKILVKSTVSATHVSKWAGKHPTGDHYSLITSKNIDIYGPDGVFVAGMRTQAIPSSVLDKAYEAYHFMQRFTTKNRSKYIGAPRGRGTSKVVDGRTITQTDVSGPDGKYLSVKSAVAGYFDKQGGRIPYCRTTAMLQHYPDKWKTVLPCVHAVGQVLRKVCPERYKAQMDYVKKTHPAWVITGSPFTTLTVNNCVAAAYHQDAGDLKEGMGAMLCYRRGIYSGAELVIPQYGIAFDMHEGDVLVFNPTLWHGNIPFRNTVGEESQDWERLTIVHYYRQGIVGCLSPEAELEQAQERGSI